MNNRADVIYNSITKKQVALILAVGGVIGAILFLWIYGFAPLDVTNDTWLVNSGDLSQHYLGWCFYRNSDWKIHPGMAEGMFYPELLCIIYTDSIPLFAVPFKILSPLLPATFQYFGLWGLMCFVLNGAFGALLLRKVTDNPWLCWIGSIFFVYSPYILQRMFGHSSLAAHWILLAGLLIIVYKPLFNKVWKRCLVWALLFLVGTFTHIYYAPMLAVYVFIFCLQDLLETGKFFRNLLTGLVAVLPAVGCLKVFGAFEGKSAFADSGLGQYSANVNALWNPLSPGISKFMPSLGYIDGQHEGLGYLGAGMLLACVVALVLFVVRGVRFFWKTKGDRAFGISVIVGLILLLLLAWSPYISCGDKIVLEIPWPDSVLQVLTIFRASGRFIWAVAYIVMCWALMGICRMFATDRVKGFGKYVAIPVLLICVVIQFYDLSDYRNMMQQTMQAKFDYEIRLSDEKWDEFGEKYDHVVMVPYQYGIMELDDFYEFAYFAQKHHMTMNFFWTARFDVDAMEKRQGVILDELVLGNVRQDTLYVFLNEEFAGIYGNHLQLQNVDDCIVGTYK